MASPLVTSRLTSPTRFPLRLAKALTWLWLAAVVAILIYWIRHPEHFTQATFERTLLGLGAWAFVGFTVASFVRGALLIPSTPFVLAGGALFPNALAEVLLVSMAGIAGSAALLYRFPGFAGYDTLLAAKYPAQLERLRVQLVKPRAVWFVALWAFFPGVPTDLICYAAGLVRMPFRRMMLGIIIGELPLVTAYVFLGTRLFELLP
ncbi:MAG: VTT domain-containing protein [Gemmatimonadota bacterium]|nr:VTT domain-containing protein [Gemmatimonadota bacterium]